MDNSPLVNLLIQVLRRNTCASALEDALAGLSGEDWGQLLDLASQQGVITILYDRLKVLQTEVAVPQPILERLREVYLEAAAQNTVMLYHAGRILKTFQAAGLACAALKGLYLVENVYPRIGLRTFSDLDLLVRRADLARVLAVMQDMGYKISTYFDLADANLDIKHIPPMEKANGPTVELHWGILEEDEPFTIDVEGLWQRVIPTRVDGVDSLALGLEDLLLHLCIHSTYQHNLRTGLKSLVDIAEVLLKFGEKINWIELCETAKAWGAERVTALTLKLVERYLGVPVPAGILEQLLPGPLDPLLVEEAARQMFTSSSLRANLTPDLAALASRRSFPARIQRIWSRIFIPRLIMARQYNVPPDSIKVYFYYPVRFLDLYRQYAGSAWRILTGSQETTTALELEQSSSRLRQWLIEGHRIIKGDS